MWPCKKYLKFDLTFGVQMKVIYIKIISKVHDIGSGSFFTWFTVQIFGLTHRQTLNFQMASILTMVPPGKQTA